MINACVVLIIGIPGAGKTTFVKKLPVILPQYGNFKVWEIIYDNILETDCPTSYKLHRQHAFTMAEQTIKDIRQDDEKIHVLVIDDNMYFKSMRYEYYKLARNYQISFFVVHFNVELSVALHRNANRENSVPEHVIINMAKKFEQPCENWEKNSLIIDSSYELNDIYSKFVTKLNQCLKEPLVSIVQICEQTPISQLQRIDLLLRKLVHKKIKNNHTNAGAICYKRTEIFKCIKNSQIIVNDNLNDAELLLYLDTLF